MRLLPGLAKTDQMSMNNANDYSTIANMDSLISALFILTV